MFKNPNLNLCWPPAGENPSDVFKDKSVIWWEFEKTTIFFHNTNILLIEEILHQSIGSFSMFIPLFTRFYTEFAQSVV